LGTVCEALLQRVKTKIKEQMVLVLDWVCDWVW
jgi:hypothetical protein